MKIAEISNTFSGNNTVQICLNSVNEHIRCCGNNDRVDVRALWWIATFWRRHSFCISWKWIKYVGYYRKAVKFELRSKKSSSSFHFLTLETILKYKNIALDCKRIVSKVPKFCYFMVLYFWKINWNLNCSLYVAVQS